jgi:hypothetical protein
VLLRDSCLDEKGKTLASVSHISFCYRGANKSLARPGRKQATVTEDFEFNISYL